MHVLWGSLMAVIGLLMLVAGTAKSKSIVNWLLVARPGILWGKATPSIASTRSVG